MQNLHRISDAFPAFVDATLPNESLHIIYHLLYHGEAAVVPQPHTYVCQASPIVSVNDDDNERFHVMFVHVLST